MFIDIEGFSKKFEDGGEQSYIHLTNDLFSLGNKYFKSLSIIQFGGDGFLIKEIFSYSNKLSCFIDISVALLQSILVKGGVGRVQISQGYMHDISGLYSEEIRNQIQGKNQNILSGTNNNIMMINTVIGTLIINCFKLKGPSGPLLLVDKELEGKLKEENIPYETIKTKKYNVLAINWIKYRNSNTDLILSNLGIGCNGIEEMLKNYINSNNVSHEWKQNALKLTKNQVIKKLSILDNLKHQISRCVRI